MEQKRTLWIVAATGIFLLVVAGAALILYSPSLHRTPVQQASFDPSIGWVTNSPASSQTAVSKAQDNTAVNQLPSQAPVSPFENGNSTESPFMAASSGVNTATTLPSNISEVHPEKLTVITDNATVYSQETTTIDLNALKASTSNNVTAQNKYTEDQIARQSQTYQKPSNESSESYYTPAPKSEVKKTVSQPAKASVAKSTASKQAPATKKSETAAKVAATAKTNPDRFWVQAAAYTSKKNADEARTTLETNKIPSEVFTFTDSNGKTFYRVRIGPYVTKSEAEYWQTRVGMIDKFADSKSVIVNSSVKTN